MKIIESNFEKKFIEENFSDFKGSSPCFLDIETTGLSRSRDLIYLVGILCYRGDNQWILKQILIEGLEEEKSLLRELLRSTSDFKHIINYNGTSFDIPFINSRLEKHGIDYKLPMEKSYDLYRLIRGNKFMLPLENLKLKTIERSLNIFREDIYSGKDCIEFFYDYIRTRSQSMEEKILKHNYEDLYYLVDIMEVVPRIKRKKSLSFEYKGNSHSLYMESIDLLGSSLNIYGRLDLALEENYISFDAKSKLEIIERDFNFKLELKKIQLEEDTSCHIINLHDSRALVIYHNKDLNMRNLKAFLLYHINNNLNS